MDPAGWTASGFAGAEAVTIAVLVVKLRTRDGAHRLRVRLSIDRDGDDPVDDVTPDD